MKSSIYKKRKLVKDKFNVIRKHFSRICAFLIEILCLVASIYFIWNYYKSDVDDYLGIALWFFSIIFLIIYIVRIIQRNPRKRHLTAQKFYIILMLVLFFVTAIFFISKAIFYDITTESFDEEIVSLIIKAINYDITSIDIVAFDALLDNFVWYSVLAIVLFMLSLWYYIYSREMNKAIIELKKAKLSETGLRSEIEKAKIAYRKLEDYTYISTEEKKNLAKFEG